MNIPEKILYSATSKTTGGGRDGHSKSSDGKLDFNLSIPKELGGPGGDGTNPEQLFSAGYSACFLGAMRFVGMRDKLKVPADSSVEATVGIGQLPTGFGIAVELKISLPGLTKEEAQVVVDKAHIVCPYSNATQGNIQVTKTIL